MGTTTKMAIPYPEATGLVKDGWEDMKDIATQVDAKSGLVLINTTSFTGVTSQSFNNVFNSNYENYVLVGYIKSATGTPSFSLRLRSAGTDASGSNYNRQYLLANGTGVSAQRANGTSFDFQYTGDTTPTQFYMQVTTPFLAQETLFTYPGLYRGSTSSNELHLFGGGHTLTTSYDGFTLLSSTSNSMTGKVSVYGWNIS